LAGCAAGVAGDGFADACFVAAEAVFAGCKAGEVFGADTVTAACFGVAGALLGFAPRLGTAASFCGMGTAGEGFAPPVLDGAGEEFPPEGFAPGVAGSGGIGVPGFGFACDAVGFSGVDGAGIDSSCAGRAGTPRRTARLL